MKSFEPDTSLKCKNPLLPLWPAIKGSLAKVYKPCIRKNCPACACGDKHPAWLLTFSDQGKRKTMYVPLALVSTLKQALQNGRKIETLLYHTGPQIIKDHCKKVKKNLKPASES
jgi:hypothetical protein